jgi:hypothetical protein
MKAGLTRIGIVLDRSGSMASILEETVQGYNKLIADQKAAPGECKVLLAQFDDVYEIVYDKDLQQVKEMLAADFKPRNSTALFDAQGRTIEALGREIAALPEQERPGTVILVTITDGKENASTDFTAERIRTMVQHQESVYNWKFLYLGANQDAVEVAAQMGIAANRAMSYRPSAKGVRNSYAATSSVLRSMRSGVGGQSVGYTVEDREQAMEKE